MLKALAACTALLWLLPLGSSSGFESATPESQGVPSTAILDFVDAIERDVDALHGFVLVRHGRIIAEGWWSPYEKDRPHMLYSLSKSFTSTAIGIAVDEGRLGLDDKVVSFFPDKLPVDPGDRLRRMRVRDLLCMGTGHDRDTLPSLKQSLDPDWVRVFLAQPVEHEPGTHFCYNTGATYMLSAILQQVTGEKLLDYLGPRLLDPLGIVGAAWETSPQGINTGGYGLKVRTRDIAALGQLYLRRGDWNGRRLLSERWVQAASSKQIDNGDDPDSDWTQGYGFQFWRCRHGAFRGDGAFGQYCLVMPDQDAVLAINSGLGDMQEVLDLVWNHLLPAMKPGPLPADPAGHERLADKLSSLSLATVAGRESSPIEKDVLGATYQFEPNDLGLRSISLRRDADGLFVDLDNVHGRQRLRCGSVTWTPGELTFEKDLVRPVGEANGRQPVAACGAWVEPDRFLARVCFRETPFVLDLKLRFDDPKVTLDADYNVAFGQRKRRLVGTDPAARTAPAGAR